MNTQHRLHTVSPILQAQRERETQRQAQGKCVHCGYTLRTTPANTLPEVERERRGLKEAMTVCKTCWAGVG